MTKLGPVPDNIVETDGALILGAGVAGLFTALKLAPMPALVVSGAHPGQAGASVWAQGGVAAALGAGDSWQTHLADTMRAGSGLCDPETAALLASEAPARVEDLLRLGTPLDRGPDGRLALGLEAAHSRARIVHVEGDRSGFAITRALAAAAIAAPSIAIVDGTHAIELAMQDGRVAGLFARQGHGNAARLVLFRGRAVVFATGGIGGLFAVTTNPGESRGEGLGMAARAGAIIADPEFVQFHPTAIAAGRDPAPLATEALRGAGCVLVDETGARYMTGVHENAELAPRDVVARATHRLIARGGKAFLDCRGIGPSFAMKFPTVFAAARAAGIDPTRELLPVAPAAHYHMGGIATDAHGRSNLPGLWACGECASAGVHGANRLASNSLLEALVFGARVAADIQAGMAPGTARRGKTPIQTAAPAVPMPVPRKLRELMTRHAGIERNAEGLASALAGITAIERAGGQAASLLDMTATAKLVVAAALLRRESRGAHYRSDYPESGKDAHRTFITLADAEKVVRETMAPPALPLGGRGSAGRP